MIRRWFDDIIHPRIQGDISGWMNMTDPLDDTHTFNATGLALTFAQKVRVTS